MDAEWPESVERVASFLRASGAEARLEEFTVDTPTAQDAAKAAGCDLAQIVKSLVVLCDGQAVVSLVPGDRRGDLEKIRRAMGAATSRVARPEEVEAATGFTPGAVAPFPLPGVDRVLIERVLLAQPTVWVGAGTSRVARPAEVESTTGFTPGTVAPFPLPGVEKVLIERMLLAQSTVWVGAGSERHLVRLSPTELVRLSKAEPMDVVEEPAYHSQPDTDGKEP